MIIELLKSKIHRATVTDANLDYIGSVTLDQTLMCAANLSEYEKVHILNITNGSRLVTYVIKGERGSGEVCINGAAAHIVGTGDLVIIVSYCSMKKEAAVGYQPSIVHVDSNNKIIDE